MAVDVVTSNSMSHQTQAVTHLHRDINRRIVDATCVMRVLDIVEEASQDFNAVNISTAFHRLARMWRDLPDLASTASNGQARLDHALQTLMQLAVSHIKEVQGQGLGIIIWALAKICYDPLKIRTLLQAFATEAISRLTQGVPKNEPNLKLGPQSLSNMVYAYAVMGHHPGCKLLNAIAQGVEGQLTDFSPQGLSNIVWAYAKLSALPNPHPDEPSILDGGTQSPIDRLLDALAVEAVKQLLDVRHSHKFIPQNLSNMVYGYAVMGHEPGAMLLLAVAQQALMQLDSFSPQEITNMVWAYAKLLQQGQPPMGPLHALLQAVPDHVVRQLADDSQHHKVRPQTVSNLLWAYASLGWAPAHLLASLAMETLRQLPFFKPQELANTMWAYATLGFTPSLDWLVQMGAACEEQVGGCKPQDLANLVWALATLQFHPGAPFLTAAMDTANRQWDKVKAGEVSNLVWGLAQLGAPAHPTLLHNVVTMVDTGSQDMAAAEVCRLLWGLAVLDSLPRKTAVTLYGSLPPHPQSYPPLALQHLAQVDVWMGSSEGSLLQLLSPAVQQAVTNSWLAVLQQRQPSQMVREVSAALSTQGILHTSPFLIEDGPLLIDIALLGPKQNTALQVQGPGQLSVNAPWAMLGGTCLLQQTLRNKGWQVISIPFYIWGMLTTAPLRGAYLHQLLQLCQAMHPQTPFTPSPTPQGLRPQAQHDPSYQLQQQLLQRMQQHSQQPSRQHVQQFGQQVQQSSQLHQQLQAQQLAQQLTQQLSQQQLSQQQLERQQGQFHQQLQRQLQQRLLAMSNADSGAGSSFQASQVPQLANQTLLVNAQVQQQMSERLQANAAEHLRTAVSQGTYDNTDTQSTVSAGHLSPLSPRCSQESQTVLPTSIAPSGTPQHSASSSAQRGLSHAVLEAQARAQQAQQGLVGGAVLSNSPVTIPPSFWAGAHGQKAMAEGQGSIPQSPSLQGLTLQGLSQQSMPSAGLSQHAVHQNALHQHGLAAHALQGQHSSSSHGSPLEGRAVGSPALARGQSQGVSQVQGGSPDAAALQSLLLQLQATGLQPQPGVPHHAAQPHTWPGHLAAGMRPGMANNFPGRLGALPAYRPAAAQAAFPYGGTPSTAAPHPDSLWQNRSQPLSGHQYSYSARK